jgi:hypothetical protein
MIYDTYDITIAIRNERNNYRIDKIRREILTGEECQLRSCKARCYSHLQGHEN